MKKHLILLVLFLLLSTLLFSSCSYQKSSMLIDAIENEDEDLVEKLLSEGVDPNIPNAPVLQKINCFLENEPELPLAVACKVGNYEIVELLVSHGATASYIENTGWSPLASTLFYYHPDDVKIIKLLLEHGADASLKESGELPVFRASRMIPKVFDSSKSNGSVFSSDYDEASAAGIVEIVKCLMKEDDLNKFSDSGTTLLMHAASSGNVELVKYLISIQADPTLQDSNGKSAYDYAIENGHSEIAELLRH